MGPRSDKFLFCRTRARRFRNTGLGYLCYEARVSVNMDGLRGPEPEKSDQSESCVSGPVKSKTGSLRGHCNLDIVSVDTWCSPLSNVCACALRSFSVFAGFRNWNGVDQFLIRPLYYHSLALGTILHMKNAVFWDVTPCRSCVNRLQTAVTCSRWFLARGLYPENWGDTFVRNVCLHNIYTALHPRRVLPS
jgi:hypothetical protein